MPKLKMLISIAVAFLFGGLCSLFDIPLPAPPTLVGAGLVVTITLSYVAGQKYHAKRNN